MKTRAKRGQGDTFDPLAAGAVHLRGLSDYAEQVGADELAREVERQIRVLEYAWGEGVDPHKDIAEPVTRIEEAFRRLAYVTCTLMKQQRGHVE